MPNGSAQPSPTPTPAPTYYVEEEPVEAEASDGLSDVLAEVALSVLNTALTLL